MTQTELKQAISDFDDFLNTPPEYEDQRMVRDFRHSAYARWRKVADAIAAVLSRTTTDDAVNTEPYLDGLIERLAMPLASMTHGDAEKMHNEAADMLCTLRSRIRSHLSRRPAGAAEAPIREALDHAATSLETISTLAGRKTYGNPPIETYMDSFMDVRLYAAARAKVAREALAAGSAQTAAPAPAIGNLHNAIMNLPCRSPQTHVGYMSAYNEGHRDARHAAAELVAAAVPALVQPEPSPKLSVWFGAMPESNGRANWTAILHRGDLSSGHTIDRSEHHDRVRYEADRVRWLIGELVDEPDILAYDENMLSPEGWTHPCAASPSASQPEPSNRCKLTECQGKPRCEPCRRMDASFGAPGSTDSERAAWLADKIVALGDYAKEAAAMLRRWPSASLTPPAPSEREAFELAMFKYGWREFDGYTKDGWWYYDHAGLQARWTGWQCRATAAAPVPSPEPREPQWQGGMTNDELLAALQSQLPNHAISERDLTIFALGVEVGAAPPSLPETVTLSDAALSTAPAQPTTEGGQQ